MSQIIEFNENGIATIMAHYTNGQQEERERERAESDAVKMILQTCGTSQEKWGCPPTPCNDN